MSIRGESTDGAAARTLSLKGSLVKGTTAGGMRAKGRRSVLRAIWRDKMHVEARALELSPPEVRDGFEHIWEPADLLMADLEALPEGLLRIWRDGPRGHLVFTHGPSLYRPGPRPWRDTTLESVCYVSMADLCGDKAKAMLAVLTLIDHLLGSWAVGGGPLLSDGGGVSAELAEVGRRFLEIHTLGYGHEELAVSKPGDYFAHTLWLYLQDPRRLNVLDPQVYKLYRNTLMREGFWLGG